MNQEKESYLFCWIFFKNFLNCNEVLQWFCHLSSSNMEVACVPEMVYPIITIIVCFWLCNLIVMMRKFEVTTSWVNINWVWFENSSCHCWAFNMPSRSSSSPRRFPERLARFWFLPKSKILRIPLFTCGLLSSQSTFTFCQKLKVSQICRL